MARQHGNIPLLGMDRRPLDRQSPDGLCETIENLRPMGLAEKPYWERIRKQESISGIGSHLDYGWYYDQRGRGLLVGLTDIQLKIMDPDDGYAVKYEYTFEESSSERTMSLAQIGELLVVAVSRDGMPGQTLMLYGEELVGSSSPPTPSHDDFSVNITTLLDPEGEDYLPRGYYSYRMAYRLKSGDYLPAGTPGVFCTLKGPNTDHEADKVRVLGYLIKPDLPYPWNELIEGAGVFVTTRLDQPHSPPDYQFSPSHRDDEEYPVLSDIGFHEGIYYLMFSYDLWRFNPGDYMADMYPESRQENALEVLPTRKPLAEDSATSLHRVTGARAYSYNNRLLLGASSLDFVKPELNGQQTGAEQVWDEPNLAIAVRIEANGREYWRWGNPVHVTKEYFLPGRPVTWIPRLFIDGSWQYHSVENNPSSIIAYPDRRATHVRFFAKGDGAGDPWLEIQAEAKGGSEEYHPGKGYRLIQPKHANLSFLLCDFIYIGNNLNTDVTYEAQSADTSVATAGASGSEMTVTAMIEQYSAVSSDTSIVSIENPTGSQFIFIGNNVGDTQVTATMTIGGVEKNVTWSVIVYEAGTTPATGFDLEIEEGSHVDKDLAEEEGLVFDTYAETTVTASSVWMGQEKTKPYSVCVSAGASADPGCAGSDISLLTGGNQTIDLSEVQELEHQAPEGFGADPPGESGEHQHEPNRIFVSEPDNPLLYRAASTQYVGTSRDRIMGFGVNTLPISQGQFGQYPLYVFTNQSIYALEQVQDASIAFGRLSPVSIRDGLVDSRAITNAGRQLFFVGGKGVGLISEQGMSYISDPVNPMLLDEISDVVCLGYNQKPEINELWVGTGDRIYVYNITHNRWSILERSCLNLLSRPDQGALYAQGEDGSLAKEDASDDDVVGTIKTHPINLGAVDYRKKLYEMIFRLQAEDWNIVVKGDGDQIHSEPIAPDEVEQVDIISVRNRYRPAYKYQVDMQATLGQGDWIESIDVESEVRMPHRRLR